MKSSRIKGFYKLKRGERLDALREFAEIPRINFEFSLKIVPSTLKRPIYLLKMLLAPTLCHWELRQASKSMETIILFPWPLKKAPS